MCDALEKQAEKTTTEDQTNLIVNYLPQSYTDDQFFNLFAEIGPVLTARVIRDKQTGYSHGYGFVDYEKAEHAAAAISRLDKFQLQHKTLKVAYSKPSGTQTKNINLYVSGLSPSATEASVRSVFGKHGDIVQCNVIQDKTTRLCQGICFVLFSARDQAESAIKSLNGQTVEELGDKQLNIKYAKNEQRNPQFSMFQSFSRNQQIPSGRGLMPVPSSGFNGASPIRNMRMIKERFSPILPSYYPPGGNTYIGGGGHPAAMAAVAASQFPGSNGDGVSTRGKVVFVYGIGPFTDEEMLRDLFKPAGTIVSVNVIKDVARGCGKGYGFVTFSSEGEAAEAVRFMDKCPYQGRLLQVSIKT